MPIDSLVVTKAGKRQTFATKHSLALVGCRFTDKRHEQNFIEESIELLPVHGPRELTFGRSFWATLAVAEVLKLSPNRGGDLHGPEPARIGLEAWIWSTI